MWVYRFYQQLPGMKLVLYLKWNFFLKFQILPMNKIVMIISDRIFRARQLTQPGLRFRAYCIRALHAASFICQIMLVSTSEPNRARTQKTTADVTTAEVVCECSDSFRLTNWALYLAPQTFWIARCSDKPRSAGNTVAD